jgi:hypothetical protein
MGALMFVVDSVALLLVILGVFYLLYATFFLF